MLKKVFGNYLVLQIPIFSLVESFELMTAKSVNAATTIW